VQLTSEKVDNGTCNIPHCLDIVCQLGILIVHNTSKAKNGECTYFSGLPKIRLQQVCCGVHGVHDFVHFQPKHRVGRSPSAQL
jgi:hypothetical protein